MITQLGDAPLGGGVPPVQWVGSQMGMSEAKTSSAGRTACQRTGRVGRRHMAAVRCLAPRAPITWIGTAPQCDLRAVDIPSRRRSLAVPPPVRRPRADCPRAAAARSPPAVSGPRSVGRRHVPACSLLIAVARMLGFDMDDIAAALAKARMLCRARRDRSKSAARRSSTSTCDWHRSRHARCAGIAPPILTRRSPHRHLRRRG